MDAAALLPFVGHDPKRTAERWHELGVDPLALEAWPEMYVLTLQHRLDGLVQDALREAGWLDLTPQAIRRAMQRRAKSAEQGQLILTEAFVELAARIPEVIRDTVLFKGAVLYQEFQHRSHRMLSDFDILLSEDNCVALEACAAELGYWKKPGLNGPTLYGHHPVAGPSAIALDVHIAGPAKYHRTEETLDDSWLAESLPHEVAGVACRRMNTEFQLTNLLTHIHEHAASWLHAVLEDDVRLLRVVDIELYCERFDVDARKTWELASALRLHGELALGLAIIHEVRGALPAALEPLAPAARRVADLTDLYAFPDGTIRRWDHPLAERAYRSDRSRLALRAAPDDMRHWETWYSFEQGFLGGRSEPIAEIAGRALDALEDEPLGLFA